MFYRPYDPLCPDRKRDGECLEIHPDPSGRETKGPESTTYIAMKMFDLINWIRKEDNNVLVEEISQHNKFAAKRIPRIFDNDETYLPYVWNKALSRAA